MLESTCELLLSQYPHVLEQVHRLSPFGENSTSISIRERLEQVHAITRFGYDRVMMW